MNEEFLLWSEKYRPKTFEDLQGQDDIVSKIKMFVHQKNLPHVLFAGPAGVGKSSLALVVAKTLFGDSWRENFLELNASDERGIDVVRIKVKDFARTKALGSAPFKIIFLDECDALTREAQQALRRTMENTTHTCRFILAANYSSKIIDPIQSRCAVFRFKQLGADHVRRVIEHVALQEKLVIEESAKSALVDVIEGDCRKLYNLLQSCAATTSTITTATVYALASMAQPTDIKDVLSLAVGGSFVEAKKKLFAIMLQFGLSGVDVIKQVQKEVLDLNIDSQKKMWLITLCGEIEFRLSEGSDEMIQLESLLAQCALHTNRSTN